MNRENNIIMLVEFIRRYFYSFRHENSYLHFVFYWLTNYKQLWLNLLSWFSIAYAAHFGYRCCFCLPKMVNKCVAFGCSSGYHTNREKVLMFSFPIGKPNLLEKWVKFVNCNEWFPLKNSFFCIKHFDEKFIVKGKWNKLSITTILSEKIRKSSLLLTRTDFLSVVIR